MSFRKATRSVHGPGKRPARQRKPPRPKQDWVSTVHDLTVHQATPEDLSRRHELHRSKNQESVQREVRQRVLKTSAASSEQNQLRDVLAQSDHMMAMVKDLFGDAPHRQTGFPSVTMALDREPVSKPVLLLDPSGAGVHGLEPLSRDVAVSRCPVQDRCHGRPLSPNAPDVPLRCPQSPSVPQCALNATPVVQKLLPHVPLDKDDPPAALMSHVLNVGPVFPKPGKRISRGQCANFSRLSSSDLHSSSGGCSSLEVLQAKLMKMGLQLDSLGPNAAPQASEDQQGDATLSGFSTALVAILGRLVQHLCRSHEEVQKEVTVRRHLEEQLREQQQLIDALTAESLLLHQDNTDLQKHVKDLDKRLDALLLALGELGGLGPEAEPRACLHGCEDTCTDAHRLQLSSAVSPEKDLGEVPSPFPAVLLSPPRQTDSCPSQTEVARGELLQYQATSSGGHEEVVEYDESTASSCSFMSLPCHGFTHSSTSKLDPAPLQLRQASQKNPLISAPSVAGRTAQRPAQEGHSVEQQLLELNRRSVEARSRLLSLIEEQRQAIGGGVSPCISPIPSARPPGVSTLLPVCEAEP
nr:spindle and centriole-associated protein 1 isoform X4 [Paramormyrops kingsleyae]